MKKIGLIIALLTLIVSGVAKTQSSDAPWVSFSTWYDHSCALTAVGKAYCWGLNYSGQLGVSADSDFKKVPTPVNTDLTFSSISVGANHTCGIAKDEQTYCWGRNDAEQLGTPVRDKFNTPLTSASDTPIVLKTDQKFLNISAGFFNTCALTKEGKAYCWGSNSGGALGSDPGAGSTAEPLAVKGKHVFVSILSGRSLSCGLTVAGEAWCWGANGFGQIGDGTTRDQYIPIRAGGEMIFSSLSLGEFHVCGVTKDNKGYCWGQNLRGKLGNGADAVRESSVPLAVAGKLEFKSISAGVAHTCGLTTQGKAYCWGSGDSGQLSVSVPNGYTSTPVEVRTKLVFTNIQAANAFTCAMATDKNIWCWGEGLGGRLGNDSTQGTFNPVQVETP